MAKIFYARVSTVEQNEARQIQAARELGADKIYLDKQSGKDAHRPQLNAMMEYIREGDTVIVESISRLARSTRDLLRIVDVITGKGAEFVSMKEAIDTSTPQGRFVLTIFAALAELEREQTHQRQAEGIAIAKEKGLYKGRQPIKIDDKQLEIEVKRWRAGEQTATQAMHRL